jgi:hypothetical protein
VGMRKQVISLLGCLPPVVSAVEQMTLASTKQQFDVHDTHVCKHPDALLACRSWMPCSGQGCTRPAMAARLLQQHQLPLLLVWIT